MLTAKALSCRQGHRPAVRRRRLHHQAFRSDRAAGAGEGHAPSREGDAEPLAAHGPAGQHPDPGRDRATGPGGHPFAVLYCDLDNFKAYNDQKGFVRGDRLIQAVAGSSRMPSSKTQGPRASSATSVATTSWRWSAPIPRRTSPSASASASMRRAPSSTSDGGSRAGIRAGGRSQGRPTRHPARGHLGRDRQHHRRQFAHYGEAVAVATEMKSFAKREPARATPSTAAPSSPRRRVLNLLPRDSYTRRKPVSGAGWNSPPAVTVRDPTAASGGWTRCDTGTDRESRDGRERARSLRRRDPRRRPRVVHAPVEGSVERHEAAHATGARRSPSEAGVASLPTRWSAPSSARRAASDR